MRGFRLALCAFATSLCVAFGASANEKLAKVETSGVFSKDYIEVIVVDDPSIEGIACYVTVAVRTMSVEDPTDSSISCRQIGPIKGNLVSQKDVFRTNKNAFFKEQHVDRIYDTRRNVLVYLSYTTKSTGKNAAHSISVVPVAMQ